MTYPAKLLQDRFLYTVLLEVDPRAVDDIVDDGLVDVAYRSVRHDGDERRMEANRPKFPAVRTGGSSEPLPGGAGLEAICRRAGALSSGASFGNRQSTRLRALGRSHAEVASGSRIFRAQSSPARREQACNRYAVKSKLRRRRSEADACDVVRGGSLR